MLKGCPSGGKFYETEKLDFATHCGVIIMRPAKSNFLNYSNVVLNMSNNVFKQILHGPIIVAISVSKKKNTRANRQYRAIYRLE